MVTINRACYCTRESVRRALDVKQANYNYEQIDRAIIAAADAVESLTQRRFYPQDGTRYKDWPNYQYAYPWRVWLDEDELAAQPTQLVSGPFLNVPVVIPNSACIFHPINYGPPFTRIELRRDQNFSFGNNTTPQNDIAITGTFGFWTQTRAAGTLAASVALGDTTVQVSDGVSVGVGDIMIIDNERMIVTDADYVNTGVAFSGLASPSANDKVITIPSGNTFVKGETLMIDSEWLLVDAVIGGTTLVTRRSWDASVLAAHTGGTIYARRLLSVLRGQLGTTAATHLNNAPVVVSDVPGLVRELAVAEATVWLAQEPMAYGGGALPSKSSLSNRGGFSVGESQPGTGLYDLRNKVENSRFTRKARSRVI